MLFYLCAVRRNISFVFLSLKLSLSGVKCIIQEAFRRSLTKVVELLSPDVVLDMMLEKNLFGEYTKITVRDIRVSLSIKLYMTAVDMYCHSYYKSYRIE